MSLQTYAPTMPTKPAVSGGVVFLDHLLTVLKLKNDTELCTALEVDKSTVSRIRHGKGKVTANMIIRAHEITDMSVRELKHMLGRDTE